jgi:hypothetical protein
MLSPVRTDRLYTGYASAKDEPLIRRSRHISVQILEMVEVLH